MKALFATPLSKFKNYRSNYIVIRRNILTLNCSLSLDWIELVEHFEKTKLSNYSDRLFKKAVDAMQESDLLVVEATNMSFEVGYLVQLANELKKPALILIEKDADLDSEIAIEIKRLDKDYTEIKKYYLQDIESILSEFVNKYRGDHISRFNLMLGRNQRNYLDWAQMQYRQNKSEIIRKLIDQQAQVDSSYQRFLNNVTKSSIF